MSEEAARLIRRMDEVLDHGPVSPAQVRVLLRLGGQVWDAVCPGRGTIRENRWPAVEAALGPEPLRHKEMVHELIAGLSSGAIPQWCQEGLAEIAATNRNWCKLVARTAAPFCGRVRFKLRPQPEPEPWGRWLIAPLGEYLETEGGPYSVAVLEWVEVEPRGDNPQDLVSALAAVGVVSSILGRVVRICPPD